MQDQQHHVPGPIPPLDVEGLENFLTVLKTNTGWQKDDSEDNKKPLVAHTYSLFEVVVLMKKNLTTIQQIYEKNPWALTQIKVGWNAYHCRYLEDRPDIAMFLKVPTMSIKLGAAPPLWLRNILRVRTWHKGHNSCSPEGYTYSPLEIVLMMQADLSTIQEVYQMYPEALTTEVVHNVCRHGGHPGVLGFLAEKLPEAIFEPISDPDPRTEQLPIHLAMRHGPTQSRPSSDDIIKLVEIYPESVNMRCWTSHPNSHRRFHSECPWESALGWTYSEELIRVMFQHYSCSDNDNTLVISDIIGDYQIREWLASPPPRGEDDSIRWTVEKDCVRGMADIAPRLTGFSSCEYCNWTVDAFLEWIPLLLKNPSMTELYLELTLQTPLTSDEFDEEYANEFLYLPEYTIAQIIHEATLEGYDPHLLLSDREEMYPYMVVKPQLFMPLVELAAQSNIRKLHLNLDREHHHLICPIMMGLFFLYMPHLEVLKLRLDEHNNLLIDAVCQLIWTSQTLQCLDLYVHEEMTVTDPWPPILSFMATNTTLKQLSLSGNPHRTPTDFLQTAREWLAGILSNTNMTLEYVTLEHNQESTAEIVQMEDTIQYLATLNRHGRGIARNPNTELAVFVDLLDPEKHEALAEDTLEAAGIRFGLLMESPTLWLSGAFRDGSGCELSRKRKRDS